MVKDDKRGHRSRWWILGGAAGLALVAAAVLVALGGRTPSASAAACALTITKTDDGTYVPIGGDIKYTLIVTNTGDAACTTVAVTDAINAHTGCGGTTEHHGLRERPGHVGVNCSARRWGRVGGPSSGS